MHNDHVQAAVNARGDTEPATDEEIETSPVGAKRKAAVSARTTSKFVLFLSTSPDPNQTKVCLQVEAITGDRSI